MMITHVRKRTGELVAFDAEKITVAIQKAMFALGIKNRKKAESLTKKVCDSLDTKKSTFLHGIPDIEQIQETVEEVLEQREERVYKAYSLYRRSRGIAREIRQYFKIRDDLKLDVNALKVLQERYLLKMKMAISLKHLHRCFGGLLKSSLHKMHSMVRIQIK